MSETAVPDGKKLVAELRPGFILLSSLQGVDFANKTIARSPDFANPKFKLRSTVLATLTEATSPANVPPIEVFVDKGGVIEVLDGDHRIVNALRHCDGDPNHPEWSRIRATRFIGTRFEAMLRAKVISLPSGRSELDDAEIVSVVEWARNHGMTDDEITDKIGRRSKKFVAKINAILNASPEVLEELKKGNVNIENAATVAEKFPLDEQGAKIQEVAQAAAAAGGNQQAARKEAGIGINRMPTLKLPQTLELLWPCWENYTAMMDGVIARDERVMGHCGAILRVLMLTPNDGEVYPNDRIQDFAAIREVIDARYAAYNEKQDRTGGKRKRA